MQINLIYNSSVDGAPAGFEVAMAAAAQFLDTLITNPVTVNIQVGFGEDDGTLLTGNESTGGPSPGPGLTYAQVVQDLTDSISTATDAEAVANLPATDPTNGGQFYVSPAEEKVFGLIPANGTEIDGTVGFSSTYQFYNYDPNDRAQPGLVDFVGVAEHELTHALGRVAGLQFATNGYEVMDLFRYTAPGTPELVSNPSGYYAPAYFSVDDGTTDLANYDTTSDPGDWDTATGPDSFDAFSDDGVVNAVTPVDTTEMNVLGFAVASPPSTVTAYTVSDEAQLNGAIAAIEFSATGLTYTITLAGGLPGGVLALDRALFPVDLPKGATLYIVGSGETIDGGGSQAGLSVAAGSVAIVGLTIADAVRAGGAGTSGAGGGGGGAGEGGGLLVDTGAIVTLANVTFAGDEAVGGAGGSAENDYDGGNGGAANNAGTVGNGASVASAAGGNGSNGQGGGGGGNFYLGPASGAGGAGGFGGGGGGGGYYQTEAAGPGGAGGFGGGDGGTSGGTYGGGGGGGGGLAAGGDVFVAQGGILDMQTGVLDAGTVIGGGGGTGGQQYVQVAGADGGGGGAYGSGVFIAGNQQILLGPAAGQTMTVGGAIDDQSGSGGTGAYGGAGTLALTGGGTVRLDAPGDYTGGTTVAAGETLDLGATGAAGSAPITLDGVVVLRIQPGVQLANDIIGFGKGDVIDFVGLTDGAAAGTVSFDRPRDQLTVSSSTGGGSATIQLDFGRQYAAAAFQPSLDAGDAGTTVTYVPCFAAGTRIDTPAGPVPVEMLRAGRLVNTADGAPRPVVWMGHRRIDCRRHARPWDVCPVRVMAGAFGPARPRCDLLLSPDHAVFVRVL